MNNDTSPGRVAVIALDGGTFDLLGPWIEAGELPTLRRLLAEGVSGELASSVPPVTATAWNSFMTGQNPGQHGFYDFVVQDRQTHRFKPANAHVRRRAFWDLLSEAGKRVVVLNVPTTYPPQPVNGVLISGFLTPPGRRDFVHPPELLPELEAKFGPYPLFFHTPFETMVYSQAVVDAFLAECRRVLETKFGVARYLLAREQPDFLLLHIFGGDQLSHGLWHVVDPGHPRHEGRTAAHQRSQMLDYFRHFDAEVGRLLEQLGARDMIMVMSDHGFGSWLKTFNVNVWLLQEGYLVLKRTPLARLRYGLWRLGITQQALFQGPIAALIRLGLRYRARAPQALLAWSYSGRHALLSLNDVDWSRTQAVCTSRWGQIRINVRGEWAQGCVEPGAEYEALREEIAAKLLALRDPDTGEPLGGRVYLKEETYYGDALADAPDLTFLPLEAGYMAASMLGFDSNRVISGAWGWSGTHRDNGLLIVAGPNVRRGETLHGAQITDLAPTILHSFGLPVPEEMDGRVLQELCVAPQRVEFSRRDGWEREAARAITAVEEAELLRRLKGLGYVE